MRRTSTSSASKSRIAFLYSMRLSRRNVSVRPGWGSLAAAASSCDSSAASIVLVAVVIGPSGIRRRHLPRPQPPDDILPGVGIPIDRRFTKRFQRKSGRFCGRVVTIKAILADKLSHNCLRILRTADPRGTDHDEKQRNRKIHSPNLPHHGKSRPTQGPSVQKNRCRRKPHYKVAPQGYQLVSPSQHAHFRLSQAAIARVRLSPSSYDVDMNPNWRTACSFLFAPLVLVAAMAVEVEAAKETSYSVGVADVDITPNYPIRLNGFGFRRSESEGVTQPIWAKAIAIGTDEEKPLVLITVDSLGMRLSMVEEVARRLKAKAGVERERLAITFTHSHTTPKVNGASDTIFSTPIPPEHQAHIDRYTTELTDALEKVALAALADRQPAQLEWAVGKVGFAKNRRTPGGPVDHDLPMLVVRVGRRRRDPRDLCQLRLPLRDAVEQQNQRRLGRLRASGHRTQTSRCVALVSIGCGSDSNPASGVTGDKTAAAAEQGAEIADEVERLLAGPLKPITGPIAATLAAHRSAASNCRPAMNWRRSPRKDDPAGYNAKFQLAKLDRGEPLQTAIDYPIQTWSFGDSLSMVFLAGEVCADYSLRLKKELDSGPIVASRLLERFLLLCAVGAAVKGRRLRRRGGDRVLRTADDARPRAGRNDHRRSSRQVPPQFRPRCRPDDKSSARAHAARRSACRRFAWTKILSWSWWPPSRLSPPGGDRLRLRTAGCGSPR